ncbi:hypothetical protein EJ08DRAFT_438029 [Tothia fuscella]|uniref:Rhodopsin domain-containing protein n=1 Tax=Tothia fuscella TaxID=1048955 RepID=A0A9P4U2J5_9PEZI|nr:hypothetical protein EJ08DRAFT_438029 [Tothia fuscella]
MLLSAITFTVSYSIVLFVFMCTSCTPLESAWTMYRQKNVPKYYCLSTRIQGGVLVTGCALSVISDAYSVILPTLLLLRLNMTMRRRIVLGFIFGVGILVVIAGIIRTVYVRRLEGDSIDKTWLLSSVFIAGIAECNIGIVCACAPSLTSYFHSFRNTTSAGSKTNNPPFSKESRVPQ